MEEWKPIPGFEGLYDVSDRGRVRSYYKPHHRGYMVALTPQRIISPKPTTSGYLCYELRLGKEGVRKNANRLVACAFLGDRGHGWVAHHINRNRADNRLANLQWLTLAENSSLGDHRGEKNGRAKLRRSDIPHIRKLIAEGISHRVIASQYGVAPATISMIATGKRWSHV